MPYHLDSLLKSLCSRIQSRINVWELAVSLIIRCMIYFAHIFVRPFVLLAEFSSAQKAFLCRTGSFQGAVFVWPLCSHSVAYKAKSRHCSAWSCGSAYVCRLECSDGRAISVRKQRGFALGCRVFSTPDLIIYHRGSKGHQHLSMPKQNPRRSIGARLGIICTYGQR